MTYDEVFAEALALRGEAALASPGILLGCVMDVSGADWQRENRALSRVLDDAALAPFAKAGTPEELAAARAALRARLVDEESLSEAAAEAICGGLAGGVGIWRFGGGAPPAGGGTGPDWADSFETDDGTGPQPRRGDDVHVTIECTGEEAARGFTRRVDYTLPSTGESASTTAHVSGVAASGAKFRVAGAGDHGRHGGGRGDLYMHVVIAGPQTEDEDGGNGETTDTDGEAERGRRERLIWRAAVGAALAVLGLVVAVLLRRPTTVVDPRSSGESVSTSSSSQSEDDSESDTDDGQSIVAAYNDLLDNNPHESYARDNGSLGYEWSYALIEMTGDGAPELVLQVKFSGGGFDAYIYTYDESSGQARQVGDSISYDADNLRQCEGDHGYDLVVCGGYGSYYRMEMKDGYLKMRPIDSVDTCDYLTLHDAGSRSAIEALG